MRTLYGENKTIIEYLEELKEIQDKMRLTVEPDEIKELLCVQTNIIGKMLEDFLGYIRPQERCQRD